MFIWRWIGGHHRLNYADENTTLSRQFFSKIALIVSSTAQCFTYLPNTGELAHR